MGPMASVIVREQLNKISGNAKGFPREKLTELIEVLSEEIFDVELRHNFRDTMLSHVKELV